MAEKSGNLDIARRYAQALLALVDSGKQDALSRDLKSLENMISESVDFQRFINNATLQRAAQVKALAALGAKAEFSPLMQNFLGTLAMKRRLAALPEIIAALKSALDARQGVATAEVTVAQALDAAQSKALQSALAKMLGREVNLQVLEDPAIIGGLIVKVGSQLIDSSVKSRLERLHRALKSSDTSKDKSKRREVA